MNEIRPDLQSTKPLVTNGYLSLSINYQYSVEQMCTRENTLARYLGAPSLDDVMSQNKLTTYVFTTAQISS